MLHPTPMPVSSTALINMAVNARAPWRRGPALPRCPRDRPNCRPVLITESARIVSVSISDKKKPSLEPAKDIARIFRKPFLHHQ